MPLKLEVTGVDDHQGHWTKQESLLKYELGQTLQ